MAEGDFDEYTSINGTWIIKCVCECVCSVCVLLYTRVLRFFGWCIKLIGFDFCSVSFYLQGKRDDDGDDGDDIWTVLVHSLRVLGVSKRFK